ncbi:C4b-binding protein beta chain isoform X3 [Saimiri boliviensis]|uniref:C4b-binding protein beta chain isoform X3 n=1 Tax=Saimiri boliviensis TaxID=27679 RepID=UPI00193DCA55|nr:C4b-binding protein beta chain isoform X3 [Saimiri boliviensis boliviensis]
MLSCGCVAGFCFKCRALSRASSSGQQHICCKGGGWTDSGDLHLYQGLPPVGHCPDPVLMNGEVYSSGPVNVSDKITFKCSDHYILKGSKWSQCLEDHTWAPPFPICKSRDCDPPGNPAHGYFEGNNFTLGSTISYHCEDRYYLVGTQEQHCIDGEWSSVPPVCKLIQEAPKPEYEKALLAFQESKDLCKAIENFIQQLNENDLKMEELKYSLELKKTELKAKLFKTAAEQM